MLQYSSGLGFATVQHLARHGVKVYLAARSEARAMAAIDKLHAEGLKPGNGTIEWLELDLSDPRKAKSSAEVFLAREKRLDILGASFSFEQGCTSTLPILIVHTLSTLYSQHGWSVRCPIRLSGVLFQQADSEYLGAEDRMRLALTVRIHACIGFRRRHADFEVGVLDLMVVKSVRAVLPSACSFAHRSSMLAATSGLWHLLVPYYR